MTLIDECQLTGRIVAAILLGLVLCVGLLTADGAELIRKLRRRRGGSSGGSRDKRGHQSAGEA